MGIIQDFDPETSSTRIRYEESELESRTSIFNVLTYYTFSLRSTLTTREVRPGMSNVSVK
jgi:hypothetical protein